MPELNVIGIVSTATHICLNKFELEESLTEAFIGLVSFHSDGWETFRKEPNAVSRNHVDFGD